MESKIEELLEYEPSSFESDDPPRPRGEEIPFDLEKELNQSPSSESVLSHVSEEPLREDPTTTAVNALIEPPEEETKEETSLTPNDIFSILHCSRFDIYQSTKRTLSPEYYAFFIKAVTFATFGSRYIAVSDISGSILRIETAGGKSSVEIMRQANENLGYCTALAFSPSGTTLYAGYYTGYVRVINSETAREIRLITNVGKSPIFGIEAWDDDFLTLDSSSTINIFSMKRSLFLISEYEKAPLTFFDNSKISSFTTALVGIGDRDQTCCVALVCTDANRVAVFLLSPERRSLDLIELSRQPRQLSAHFNAPRYQSDQRVFFTVLTSDRVMLYELIKPTRSGFSLRFSTSFLTQVQLAEEPGQVAQWISESNFATFDLQKKSIRFFGCATAQSSQNGEIVSRSESLEELSLEINEDVYRSQRLRVQVVERPQAPKLFMLDTRGILIEFELFRMRNFFDLQFDKFGLEEALRRFQAVFQSEFSFFSDFILDKTSRETQLHGYFNSKIKSMIDSGRLELKSSLNVLANTCLSTNNTDFLFLTIKPIIDAYDSSLLLKTLEPLIKSFKLKRIRTTALLILCEELMKVQKDDLVLLLFLNVPLESDSRLIQFLDSKKLYLPRIILSLQWNIHSFSSIISDMISSLEDSKDDKSPLSQCSLTFWLLSSGLKGRSPIQKTRNPPFLIETSKTLADPANVGKLFAADKRKSLIIYCSLLTKDKIQELSEVGFGLSDAVMKQIFEEIKSLHDLELQNYIEACLSLLKIPYSPSKRPEEELINECLKGLEHSPPHEVLDIISKLIAEQSEEVSEKAIEKMLEIASNQDPNDYSRIVQSIADIYVYRREPFRAIDVLLGLKATQLKPFLFHYLKKNLLFPGFSAAVLESFKSLYVIDTKRSLDLIKNFPLDTILKKIMPQLKNVYSLRMIFSNFILKNYQEASNRPDFLGSHAELLALLSKQQELIEFIDLNFVKLDIDQLVETLSIREEYRVLAHIHERKGEFRKAFSNYFQLFKEAHRLRSATQIKSIANKMNKLIEEKSFEITEMLGTCPVKASRRRSSFEAPSSRSSEMNFKSLNLKDIKSSSSPRSDSKIGMKQLARDREKSDYEPISVQLEDLLESCKNSSHKECLQLQAQALVSVLLRFRKKIDSLDNSRPELVQMIFSKLSSQSDMLYEFLDFLHEEFDYAINSIATQGKLFSSNCAICSRRFGDGESVVVRPFCRHIYHSKCVKRERRMSTVNDDLIPIEKKPNPMKEDRTCPVCNSIKKIIDNPDGSSVITGQIKERLDPISSIVSSSIKTTSTGFKKVIDAVLTFGLLSEENPKPEDSATKEIDFNFKQNREYFGDWSNVIKPAELRQRMKNREEYVSLSSKLMEQYN